MCTAAAARSGTFASSALDHSGLAERDATATRVSGRAASSFSTAAAPGMAAAELTNRQWWWLYAVLFAAAGFAVALLAFPFAALASFFPRG